MGAALLLQLPAVLAEPSQRLPWLVEQIAELERSGSRVAQSVLPNLRSVRAVALGDIDTASRELATSLRISLTWRRYGDVIAGLDLVASLGVGLLDPEIPATIMGALDAASQRYGMGGPPWPEFLSRATPAERLVELERQLGPDRLRATLERGRHLSLEEIVGYLEERATTGRGSADHDRPL